MKRAGLLTLLAATGLIAAGCGGDDETTESGATGATGATGVSDAAPIPLDDWVTQADDICAVENDSIDQAAQAEGISNRASEAQVESFTEETLIPSLQAQHDALAALPPPEGSEDEAEELLTAVQKGIDELKADPVATLQEDSAFDEANRLAKEIGLKECGEG